MECVLVPGTGSWRNDGRRDWYYPDSEFGQWLIDKGLTLATDPGGEPFIWSTEVGGVGFGSQDLVGWAAAGKQLYWWCVPPRCPDRQIPSNQLVVIAHSHGMQVALYAAAFGLKIAHLITVAGPVRADMEGVTSLARKNIAYWTHIHSDKSDWWQVLGSLFDGRLGIYRKHPAANYNILVKGVGHSKLLRDKEHLPVWNEIIEEVYRRSSAV